MRGQAADHVVVAVSVDIIGKHVRAAVTGGKWKFVLFPDRIPREGLGLLPPTILLDQIFSSVAIHIANAKSVRELVIVVVGRYGMPFPRFRGVVPIRFSI